MSDLIRPIGRISYPLVSLVQSEKRGSLWIRENVFYDIGVRQPSPASRVLSSVAFAAPASNDRASYKADNTKINVRDRKETALTADQQPLSSNNETTATIRRAIVKDDSLSTNAHNIKIINKNGTVLLRGPVNSEKEKEAVEAKAVQVVGAKNVKNELDIRSMKASAQTTSTNSDDSKE